MADDDHVLDLLPIHALGALEADEARRVEAHLAGCLTCRAELSNWQAQTADLALAAAPAAPPPDLRNRLMQRVAAPADRAPLDAARRARPARPGWNLRPAWGLATLLLIAALAAFGLGQTQRLSRLERVTAPGGMRAVALVAAGAAPDATGFVLVGVDGRNGAMVVDRLPPLDADHEYQAWLLRDGERTSAAVFGTDEEGYRGLRLEAPRSLLDYSALEVTIEPAGGSPQPTGAIVLSGTLFDS